MKCAVVAEMIAPHELALGRDVVHRLAQHVHTDEPLRFSDQPAAVVGLGRIGTRFVFEMSAVRDRAAQRVVLFEDLSMATVPKSRRVTATVTLALGGQVETVSEEGPDTQRNRMESAARAAVLAMCNLFSVNALALEGVQQAEMFGRNVAVVGVLAANARDSRLLMGTAEVRESLEHAAVYAVLDATNRWAVAHKPR